MFTGNRKSTMKFFLVYAALVMCLTLNQKESIADEDFAQQLFDKYNVTVLPGSYLSRVANKINPGEPLDKDIYDLPPEEAAEIPKTPGSLDDALDALERDHDFLLRGDVFTQDVVDTWIHYKRENEADAIRLRPHPYEFCLYYDI